MSSLQQEAELSQKQLADRIALNEMDVSRILDRLEPYGYVARERAGAEKTVRMNW